MPDRGECSRSTGDQPSGDSLPLEAGRVAFGGDPSGYAAARPDYPKEVAVWLRELCPNAGAEIFEIGPGTGVATQMLLELAPARLEAIEPDKRLAEYLQQEMGKAAALRVCCTDFEACVAKANSFDLGVAATSFHWLNQKVSLAKVFLLLRPGGWWSMWWNVFGNPDHPDAFDRECGPLFRNLIASPSWAYRRRNGQKPFPLDEALRRKQMEAAGFRKTEFRRIFWTVEMDTTQVVALASTFSQVSQTTEERRSAFLSVLAERVEKVFGGRVERHFSTAFYTGRKPGD